MNREIFKIILSLIVSIAIVVSAIILKDTQYENTWLYITCIWIIILPLLDLYSKKNEVMRKVSLLFFQTLTILLGIITFTFMLVEPHFEGRNINATAFEVYLKDPFLIYAYTASIAFFIGLYQILKILGHVRENKMFSPSMIKALHTLKRCAVALIAFVIAPLAYLFIVRPEEDIAGGVAVGLFILLISTITAIIASKFERVVQTKIK